MRCTRNWSFCLAFLAFVLLTGLVTSGPSYSADKPIEFSFATSLPVQYPITQGLDAWGKEVEKRTGGRVKITYFHASSLADAVQAYDAVVNGICDIAMTFPANNRGRFPLTEALELPGLGGNALLVTHVHNDWVQKMKPKELDDTHFLYAVSNMPGVIYSTKPFRTLEDLKGSRIRCSGMTCKTVELLGAVPVAMPKPDVYDALQKGIVDGASGTPNELKYWRMTEVTKYTTYHAETGYLATGFVVMNKAKWNSLTPDLKKIIDEVNTDWQDHMAKILNAVEQEGVEYGKAKGHIFLMLSPEEAARWTKAVEPMYQDYVKRMSAKGLPGKEALAYREQLHAKYRKIYQPVLKF